MNHLDWLESESMYILREVVTQFQNPCILFSGGKDSAVVLYLAQKALYPEKLKIPVVHIDTGHNFQEALDYRDKFVSHIGCPLIVGRVQDDINSGAVVEEHGYNASRNVLQTTTLLRVLDTYQFDCAVGGARRDEEKARAKERIFSHRNAFGQWTPENQRPEVWDIYNTHKTYGETFRVFPLSNWTELDVWEYIERENIDLPSIYFAHQRKVFERNGQLLAAEPDYIDRRFNEVPQEKTVRCRTVGDVTCTGLIESEADTVAKIIEEIKNATTSERGSRADDSRSLTAMEDRKRNGYF